MTMLDLYRGNVNTWECDEMGHMNVRFYVVKTEESLRLMLTALGLGPRALAGKGHDVEIIDQHIRFHRELHAGTGIEARGGVLAVGADTIRVYAELYNSFTGTLSATANMLARHVDAESREARPWPRGLVEAAQGQVVDLPEHGAPRSFNLDPPRAKAGREEAERLSLTPIYRGVVRADECDGHGLLRTEGFIGKVSDGVVNLLKHFHVERTSPERRGEIGGAVLEYRLNYRRRPRVGDVVEIRSGLAGFAEKTNTLGHWILDAETGEALATGIAVGITMDLKARKAIAIPEERREVMAKYVQPELGI
jgi:acyl-CoA thioester hydrolase